MIPVTSHHISLKYSTHPHSSSIRKFITQTLFNGLAPTSLLQVNGRASGGTSNQKVIGETAVGRNQISVFWVCLSLDWWEKTERQCNNNYFPLWVMTFLQLLGERPFKCHICQKAFKQSSDLKKHINLHTGANQFKCEECNMEFRRADALRKHKLGHKMGNMPCGHCGKNFLHISALRQHRAMHNGKTADQYLHAIEQRLGILSDCEFASNSQWLGYAEQKFQAVTLVMAK